jgi:L-ascorbate metabolism protein UlaG (beta-lactamase superfamily)
MVINYLGGECFKVSFGDITLAFNPASKDSSVKTAKFGSDIVLVSLNNPDFNGIENAQFGERAPFIVAGPGEYEIKEITVKGFASKSGYGAKGSETYLNTVYFVTLEGMNLCFLGALGTADLPQEAKEELEDVDILFTPIGGSGVLDHAESYKLAVKLEPHVIIPMHYGDMGGKDALKSFLKEAGAESVKPIDKLTLKKKDLDGKQAEVVVLAN